MNSEPTLTDRLRAQIKSLERRNRQQKHQLQIQNAILVERKAQLEALGIAWSTRGSEAKAEELTEAEVKRLVDMVDRIQWRHLNIRYRLKYETLDEQVRNRIESLEKAWRQALEERYNNLRRARRWKKLAKKLRSEK